MTITTTRRIDRMRAANERAMTVDADLAADREATERAELIARLEAVPREELTGSQRFLLACTQAERSINEAVVAMRPAVTMLANAWGPPVRVTPGETYSAAVVRIVDEAGWGDMTKRREAHPAPIAVDMSQPEIDPGDYFPIDLGVLSAKRGGKVTELWRLAREIDDTTAKPPQCARCGADVTFSAEPALGQIADEHDDPGTGTVCHGGGVR